MLHENLCEPQETYQVITPVGKQEQPFPKGEYKKYPNHVVRQDGSIFAYAPVDKTADEMKRLVDELRTEEFINSHPVLQAAYAHYAFVRIHPFADGNGRVARAFASLYLFQGARIPLVIFADQREEYFRALDQADGGGYKVFVEFISSCAIETIKIQIEFLKSTSNPPLDETVQKLTKLFVTDTGFRYHELDDKAYQITNLAENELKRQIAALDLPNEISIQVSQSLAKYDNHGAYRPPIKNQGRNLSIAATSQPPANAKINVTFQVYISKGDVNAGELLLRAIKLEDQNLNAHSKNVESNLKQAIEIQLTLWAQGVIANVLKRLEEKASESLNQSGYI